MILSRDLPSLDELQQFNPEEVSKIYSADGVLLKELHLGSPRDVVKISQIPKNLRSALLVMEDRDFYEHHGINIKSTFRALLETYVTFHNLFVEPKSEQEAELRFLVWKLDGLYQKRKYDIDNSDFKNAEDILKKDNELINNTQKQIEKSEFFKNLNPNQSIKIYNPECKSANWRFLIKNDIIKPKKIIDLVEHVCKQKGFVNLYKYSSIHSHSNFPAIAEFKDTRGKILSDTHTEPITNYATIMTCLLISDICEIDKNAKSKFDTFPGGVKEYINGITKAIKKCE